MAQFGLNVSWESGNVSYFQLNKFFKPFGAIEVNLKNVSAGSEGGKAFVKFKTYEEALTAHQKTNGSDIGGVTITVEVEEQSTVYLNQKTFSTVSNSNIKIAQSKGIVPKSGLQSNSQVNIQTTQQQSTPELVSKQIQQLSSQTNASLISQPNSSRFEAKSGLQSNSQVNIQSSQQQSTSGFVPKSELQSNSQVNIQSSQQQSTPGLVSKQIQQLSSQTNASLISQPNSSRFEAKSGLQSNSQVNIQSSQQQSTSGFVPKSGLQSNSQFSIQSTQQPSTSGFVPKSGLQSNSQFSIQSTQQPSTSGFVPKSGLQSNSQFSIQSTLPSQYTLIITAQESDSNSNLKSISSFKEQSDLKTTPQESDSNSNLQSTSQLNEQSDLKTTPEEFISQPEILLNIQGQIDNNLSQQFSQQDEPKYNDFEIDKKFFGGAMGKTFLVKYKPTGQFYVMKRVDYLDEKDKKMADDEIAQMRKLTSRYTVRLEWTFTEGPDMYVVTEYCSRGDTRKLIKELQQLPESERINRVWELFAHMALALNFMHSKGVLHRDIKPENIFIMEDGSARLGDFGLSKQLLDNDYYAKVEGTKFYIAPEIYLDRKMYFESDIYALGIVLFELITGTHPFYAGNEQETIENITKGKHSELPNWVPIEMKKLILNMLTVDYHKRPTTEQLIEFDIIKDKISQFEQNEKLKQEQIENEQKSIKLFPPQIISLFELKSINEEIQCLNEIDIGQENIYMKLKNGLSAVRYVQGTSKPQKSDEMQQISNEIINKVVNLVKYNMITKERIKNIQFSIQSGVIIELIDLLTRTNNNQTQEQIFNIIDTICTIATPENTDKLFEMNIFNSITPILLSLDSLQQMKILKQYKIIIQNGYQQQKSSQLSILSNSSSQSFENRLQQLLLIPHPYLAKLEKQGIIKQLIENILMNKKSKFENKQEIFNILNILYIEGIKLPPEYKQQIIEDLCQQMKLEYKIDYYSYALALLSINKDNHQMIFKGEFIKACIEFFKKAVDDKNINSKITSNLLTSLHYLYLYSEPITQKLIHKEISNQTLLNLKINNRIENQILILESTFVDVQTVSQLVEIKRMIQNTDKDFNIQLIKSGLIQLLYTQMKQTIQQNKKGQNGKLILIQNIFELLIKDNLEACQIIIEETEFISLNIKLFNQISTSKLNFFDKGIVQPIIKFLNSKDMGVRMKICEILLNIIESGLEGLNIGEQHPYRQQLFDDGNLDELVHLFLDKDKKDIHKLISIILACLFKASPVPPDFCKDLIEELKLNNNQDYINLINECNDNHNLIIEYGLLLEPSNTNISSQQMIYDGLEILAPSSVQSILQQNQTESELMNEDHNCMLPQIIKEFKNNNIKDSTQSELKTKTSDSNSNSDIQSSSSLNEQSELKTTPQESDSNSNLQSTTSFNEQSTSPLKEQSDLKTIPEEFVPQPQSLPNIQDQIDIILSPEQIQQDEPKYNDFEIDKKFFGGAMGKTFLVKYKPTGQFYVMKRVDYFDEKDKKMADDEIAQMRKLTSRYTVRLEWTFTEGPDMYVVTEYCSRGDTRKLIKELQQLPQEERINHVWELFAQMVLALNFMHSKGVLHRDIKPENIFIMLDGRDFGLSKQLLDNDYYAKVEGTKFYMAPEIYMDRKMYFESDIYALGIVLFELITGTHPFYAGNEQETIENITKGKHYELPNWVPIEMKKLILNMLSVDYHKRPITEQLIEIDIIKDKISQFEQNEKLKQEQIENEQKSIKLFPPQIISLIELKSINEEIQCLNEIDIGQEDIYMKLKNGLSAVRYVQGTSKPQKSDEMQQISNEIINKVVNLVKYNMITKERIKNIQFSIQSGVIIELIDLLTRTNNNQTQEQILNIIDTICTIATPENTDKLFEMNIFNSITPILLSIDSLQQMKILKQYKIIIQNGQQQQKSSQLSILSNSSSQSFENRLQQLLLIPHPYLAKLEKQGIIKQLIENILMNKKSKFENKQEIFNILDILYIEGIKLPPEYKQQIIEDLCQQMKLEYKIDYYSYALALLSINKDNYQMIIQSEFLKSSLNSIMQDFEERIDNLDILQYQIKTLKNIYLFGDSFTQNLLLKEITADIFNKFQKNNTVKFYSFNYSQQIDKMKDQIEILEAAFANPRSFVILQKIIRLLRFRDNEFKIEFLRQGLIQLINDLMKNMIEKEISKKGWIIYYFSIIINQLVQNNPEACQYIIEQTEFIEIYLLFLNSISQYQQIKEFVWPIKVIVNNSTKNLYQQLFQKGIVQVIVNTINQEQFQVRNDKEDIILNLIKFFAKGLKFGEQHPLNQQLQLDGTISKLISLLHKEKDNSKHNIVLIFAYLFKALPLPPEIKNNVIEKLKSTEPFKSINFEELSLLAECPDNHDAIFANQFEMKLFKDDSYTLEYLNFSLLILKYGSFINKCKLSLAIKKKVEQLANDVNVDELGNKCWPNWNSDKKQEIKSKIKELLPIISQTFNENDNVNLISQLVLEILDSKDKDIRKDLIQIILSFIKLKINGLKEGEQHPFHQQFQSDGTIPKLIQIFKEEKDKEININIAQTLAYLFKALPLPPEIRTNIIEQLKKNNDFNFLSLLCECADNHDSILVNGFEKKLFEHDYFTLKYLNFSLPILKYGSNINKLKVASVIKDEVEQLINDEYIDELGNRWNINWNEDKKQEIKSKTQETVEQIKNIEKQQFYKEYIQLAVNNDQLSIKDLEKLKKLIDMIKKEDYEQKIQQIKQGLMNNLIKTLEGLFKNVDNKIEDQEKLCSIYSIFNKLFQDNLETKEFVLKETNFVEQYLHFLSITPINIIQHEYFFVLTTLFENISNDLKQKLFKIGVIQTMIKFFNSEDNSFQFSQLFIIYQILHDLQNLKEGEKHPYFNQLTEDGTIKELIRLFDNFYNNESNEKNGDDDEEEKFDDFDIYDSESGYLKQYLLAQILSELHKAVPIPPEIQKEIIDFYKKNLNDSESWIKLFYLAECPDNHEAILENDFENQLFKENNQIVSSFKLTFLILKFGSEETKIQLSQTLKEKMNQLSDEDYLDEIRINDIEQIEIIQKAKEILSQIRKIIGEEEKEEEEINCNIQ